MARLILRSLSAVHALPTLVGSEADSILVLVNEADTLGRLESFPVAISLDNANEDDIATLYDRIMGIRFGEFDELELANNEIDIDESTSSEVMAIPALEPFEAFGEQESVTLRNGTTLLVANTGDNVTIEEMRFQGINLQDGIANISLFSNGVRVAHMDWNETRELIKALQRVVDVSEHG